MLHWQLGSLTHALRVEVFLMFAAASVASISLHHCHWPCTAIPSSCPPHTALLALHPMFLKRPLHALTLHSLRSIPCTCTTAIGRCTP